MDVGAVDLGSRRRRVSGTRALSGQNASFPLYDTEKVAFKAPAGNVWIRFRFAADDLVGSPPYTGVAVDDVVVKR